MKKTQLMWGLGFLALAALLMYLGAASGVSVVSSMGWGFAGVACGYVWRYCYWTRPSRAGGYEEHLRQERLKAHDEMLVMLRRQAGHICYTATLLLLTALLFASALCMSLHRLQPFAEYTLYLVTALLLLEYIGGILIFQWLKRRY